VASAASQQCTEAHATVLVVDDEPSVTRGIELALRHTPFEILTANSADSALTLLREHSVQVVVSDERMPGMSGIELLTLVRAEFPSAARIMLTGHATVDVASRAINEGRIAFFLQKPCPAEDLIEAISTALTARPDSAQATAGAPSKDVIARNFPRKDFQQLSAREKEVLYLIVDGQRLGQIAKALFISPHTVRNHLKVIFRKLDVHSQSELMHKGRRASAIEK
jgi:DNA-binding NarL/FixJ family response regulator